MAIYICKNYGSCTKADAKEAVELLPGAEPVCEECGFSLEAVDAQAGSSAGHKRVTIGASAVAALIVAGLVGVSLWGGTDKSTKSETKVVLAAPATSGVRPDEQALAAAKKNVDKQIVNQSGATTGTVSDQKAVIAKEYVKAAIPLMQAGKYQEAEAQLARAQQENPDEPLVFINRAIIHLKQNREHEALLSIQTAFGKGFKDFNAIEGDADLKPLIGKPTYAAMAAPFKQK